MTASVAYFRQRHRREDTMEGNCPHRIINYMCHLMRIVYIFIFGTATTFTQSTFAFQSNKIKYHQRSDSSEKINRESVSHESFVYF